MAESFISLKVKKFSEYYQKLPKEVKQAAVKAFKLFMHNPFHPSLHFKCVDRRRNVWSIRITINYRALCYREGNKLYWFWIGNHEDYEQELKKL